MSLTIPQTIRIPRNILARDLVMNWNRIMDERLDLVSV
jgi:hypothetical protein